VTIYKKRKKEKKSTSKDLIMLHRIRIRIQYGAKKYASIYHNANIHMEPSTYSEI